METARSLKARPWAAVMRTLCKVFQSTIAMQYSHLALVMIAFVSTALPMPACAESVSRKWMNDAGKVIEAELGSYDGTDVTLLMKGKEFKIPVEKLSKEDRGWLAEWQEGQKKLKQQQAGRVAELLGVRKNAPISHRYGQATDDYFKGPFGKSLRNFYDTKISICDDGKKGLFMKCDESVAWKDQTILTYCPIEYKGDSTPMGVYINISPGDGPIGLVNGYDKVMVNRKMIYASPSGTSNSRSDVRRMALALDTLATLRAEYKIDESRLFVGGMSGGGAMSSWMAVYFPEFRGAINQVRTEHIPSETCFPTVEQGDVRSISKRKQAYVFVTGSKDFNYKGIVDSIPNWENQGFVVKLFDVPGMGHGNAPAEALEEALKWAEESSESPKNKGS